MEEEGEGPPEEGEESGSEDELSSEEELEELCTDQDTVRAMGCGYGVWC